MNHKRSQTILNQRYTYTTTVPNHSHEPDEILRLHQRIAELENTANEHNRIEQNLLESRELFAKAFQSNPIAVAVIVPGGPILEVNDSFQRITGYTRDEIIGRSSVELGLISEDNRAGMLQMLRETGSLRDVEVNFRDKDGNSHTLLQSFQVIELNGVQRLLTTFHDITVRKRAEEALRDSERKYRNLSIIDELTSLYNVRHFYYQLDRDVEHTKRHGETISLLLLDIDNFKLHNDTYGHLAGDAVLSYLGKLILRSIRKIDSAYRYGGEEFTIILPETEGIDAVAIADRIRKKFHSKKFCPMSQASAQLTISIGITEYIHGEELASFVNRADRAMYLSKENGKNQVFFLNPKTVE